MPIDGRTVIEVKVDFKMFEAVSGIYYLGGYIPVGGGCELAGEFCLPLLINCHLSLLIRCPMYSQ